MASKTSAQAGKAKQTLQARVLNRMAKADARLEGIEMGRGQNLEGLAAFVTKASRERSS